MEVEFKTRSKGFWRTWIWTQIWIWTWSSRFWLLFLSVWVLLVGTCLFMFVCLRWLFRWCKYLFSINSNWIQTGSVWFLFVKEFWVKFSFRDKRLSSGRGTGQDVSRGGVGCQQLKVQIWVWRLKGFQSKSLKVSPSFEHIKEILTSTGSDVIPSVWWWWGWRCVWILQI